MFENDPNNLRNFFHPILVNGFLVLRLKLNPFIPKTIPQTTLGFPNTTWLYSSYEINLYCKKIKKKFAKSPGSYDTNPLTDKITKNKEITFDNINSENLSSDNNASSQEKVSFNKYKKNRSLLKHQNTEDVFAPYGHLWTFCKNCEKSIYKEYAQKNKYICQHCAFHLPMGSLDRIESLIDSGTWDPTDENMVSIDDIPYIDKVHFSQRKTGLTDAIQTGIGKLDGIPVALAVMDFQFIGGSMGSVVGEKITRLIESARVLGLPIIISCASGGARMQEGSFSLMQMAKISSILLNYPFFNDIFLVSLLTSPTTGGVTASFGMLGDIIIGEPEAYIAFAGKRVIEQVMKIEVPPGIQEAEYLFEKGSLDSIVPRNLLKGVLSELFKFHPSLILKAMRKKRNWRV
uniref:acetyl-CoA carboxylase n=1 Tax=Cyperus amuricus TaxID=1249726 RepID=UPI002A82F943|nr:acetyl-CoA carboxylase [Cyperus amuricus]WOL36725.1 acetyl-CoA carboxylase [Cyperus amuricus]